MSPARPLFNRVAPGGWLTVALLLAVTPSVGTAQVFDTPGTVVDNGTELFRAALHAVRIKPITQDEYRGRGPTDDMILVILGPGPNEPGEFNFSGESNAGRVLRAGGAVLYASDTESGIGNSLPGNSHLRVHHNRVAATDPTLLHNPAHQNSPVLQVWEPGLLARGPVWDIFRGLRHVATEDPSCFVVGSYTGVVQHRVADFPPGCGMVPPPMDRPTPPPPPDTKRGPRTGQNPFAVAGAGPDEQIRRPYRFLAMANQAVLLNRLLSDPSTDNLELARRTVAFLQDPGGKNRTRCLFVVRGRVVEDFESAYRYAVRPPSSVSVPAITWEKIEQMIVDGGNRIIDHAEENDILNRMALGPESEPARRERNLQAIIQGLLVAGSVCAVWIVLRRVWRARQPGEQPRPPTVGGPPRPGPAGIFNRREQELLRRNNLYEPVRDLLRDFFAAAGAPPDAGRKPSRLVFESTGGNQARLRTAIEELWRIAYGRTALVSVHQWQDLESKFEVVRRAFEDGVWRFEATAAVTGRGEG
jgi:hypothetical protein